MEIKVIATRIDFTTHTVTGSDAAVTFIDLEKPHTRISGLDIPMNVPGKGTLMVVLQVRLHMKDGASANRQCNAVDIIAVVPDQPLEVISAKSKPTRN